MASTVQYRPSEKKIVFGLKVPSGDGLGLILQLKYVKSVLMSFKGQKKAKIRLGKWSILHFY